MRENTKKAQIIITRGGTEDLPIEMYDAIASVVSFTLLQKGIDLQSDEFDVETLGVFYNWSENSESIINKYGLGADLKDARKTFTKASAEDAFFDMHDRTEKLISGGCVKISFTIEGSSDFEKSGLTIKQLTAARGNAQKDMNERAQSLVLAVERLLTANGYKDISVQHSYYGLEPLDTAPGIQNSYAYERAGINPF